MFCVPLPGAGSLVAWASPVVSRDEYERMDLYTKVEMIRALVPLGVVIQRCTWHKRENVARYLAKRERAAMRQRLQRAYDRPTYAEARDALTTLYRELDERNLSTAA